MDSNRQGTATVSLERRHAWLAWSLMEKLPRPVARTLALLRDHPKVLGDALLALWQSHPPPPSLLKTELQPDEIAQLEAALDWLDGPLQAMQLDPRFDAALGWAQHENQFLLCADEPLYPQALVQMPEVPPPVLYIQGRLESLKQPAVAIIGSRQASHGGELTARRLATDLSRAGLVIASGLARGIDAAAHRACIEAGGLTLAVQGSACDRCYPAAHAELSRCIADGAGALIGEFPPGTPTRPWNFPRRNRLVSGLSLGVIVVEAGWKSGTLGTARLAAEQGREVMAVPGSIHAALSHGCHSLLRDGATLIECADDVLYALRGELERWQLYCPQDEPARPFRPTPAAAMPAEMAGDETARTVLQRLAHDPISADGLLESLGSLDARTLIGTLARLELAGLIEQDGGGNWIRRSD